jgi:hypothetical protein
MFEKVFSNTKLATQRFLTNFGVFSYGDELIKSDVGTSFGLGFPSSFGNGVFPGGAGPAGASK